MTAILQTKPRKMITPTQLLSVLPTALGHDSRVLTQNAVIANAAVLTSPAQRLLRSVPTGAAPCALDEQLYDARATFKILTNSVAMHFDQQWHRRFFAQLDAVMDVEEWDRDDKIITEPAFRTLLRVLLMLRGKRRPGLAVGPAGSIIATWTAGANRLTLECHPADAVRWIVTQIIDGETDTGAGQTTLVHLFERLASFNPDQWFENEGSKPQA
jgi:hypothetical protein